jgi:hypothetical protein
MTDVTFQGGSKKKEKVQPLLEHFLALRLTNLYQNRDLNNSKDSFWQENNVF